MFTLKMFHFNLLFLILVVLTGPDKSLILIKLMKLIKPVYFI